MKIKIEVTLNVDAEEFEAFRDDEGYHGDTISEFVRDWVISNGVGSIESALMNAGFDHRAVEVDSAVLI